MALTKYSENTRCPRVTATLVQMLQNAQTNFYKLNNVILTKYSNLTRKALLSQKCSQGC